MGNSETNHKKNKYEFDKINRTIDSFTSDCTIEDTEYINKLKLKKRKKLNDIKNIENKVLINSIYIALNFQNYKKNKEVYEQFPPNISLYNSLINNNNLKDDFKFTEQYIFLNKLLDNEQINLRLSNLNNLSYDDNFKSKNDNNNNNYDEESNNENNLSDFLNIEREKIKEKKKSKFNKKINNNNLHLNNNEDENDIINKYNLKVSKILISNENNDDNFENNKNNKIMKTVNNIINENNNIDDNMNKFKNKNNIIKKRENSNDKPHQRNPFVISKFNNNINNKIQSNTPDNKYKFLPKNLKRNTLFDNNNNNNNFNYNKENYRKTEGNKNNNNNKNKKSPLKTSFNVHNSRIKNKNNINNINESNIIKIDIRDALNKLKQMKIISSDDLQ